MEQLPTATAVSFLKTLLQAASSSLPLARVLWLSSISPKELKAEQY